MTGERSGSGLAGTGFAGTGTLVWLALRRDRVVLPVWVVLLGVMPVFYASSISSLYPTAADREAVAAGVGSTPAEVALVGPVFGSSVGALTAWRSGFLLVLVGLAGLLTVIRHSRAEEEAGRRELLGATAVGRSATLVAALLVALGASLVAGALTVGGLVALGLPVAGSVALGASSTAAGWVFAAVGAGAAQLTSSARTARGIAGGVLGLSFVLRALGDAAGGRGLGWASWLSPIGWLQRVRPYAGKRWALFVLTAVVVGVLAAAAYALNARRDLGAGVLPARPGPATAPGGLSSPLALAWRLQRGTLLGWAVGFAVVGAAVGGIANDVGQQLGGSGQLQDWLTRLGGRSGLTDAFLAAELGVLGLVAAAYAAQAALRLHVEEAAARAEPVLAGAVGRLRWASSHLVIAVLGPAVLLAVAGSAAGLAYGLSAGDVGRQLPRVLAGALLQLPAVWVMAGIAAAVFGLLPRLAAAATWGALVLFLLLGQVGQVLRLDQRALDLSPFTHLPKVPGGAVTVPPLLWLLVVAAGLAAGGLAGVRRRDIG